ncbi:MAG: hypothetical protein ACR2LR_20500 [Hassallia sp.]
MTFVAVSQVTGTVSQVTGTVPQVTGTVKARDAINRRLYKGLIIVKTAIYRVFLIYDFRQKTLSQPDWERFALQH